MTDHTANAFDYLDGYTDAYNGIAPRRDGGHYREGYEAGKQQEAQPAPFCAPGEGDCEACQ